jgi:hypothetical protein
VANSKKLIDVEVSSALPGRAHDLTAARTHRIIRICERQGVPLLADRAYTGGSSWVTTALRRPPNSELPPTQLTVNRAPAQAGAPVERGVARLKSWRIFRRSRCSPNRMTSIAKARPHTRAATLKELSEPLSSWLLKGEAAGQGCRSEHDEASVVGVVFSPPTEASLVPYSATLDVLHELVQHMAFLWTPPGDQLALAQAGLLHTGPACTRASTQERDVCAGFGVSQTTAWRHVDETLDVLAAWAPGLHETLAGLGEGEFVIADGTLIPTDRVKADEPYYSQKHRKHAMNVQVIVT